MRSHLDPAVPVAGYAMSSGLSPSPNLEQKHLSHTYFVLPHAKRRTANSKVTSFTNTITLQSLGSADIFVNQVATEQINQSNRQKYNQTMERKSAHGLTQAFASYFFALLIQV